jgi:23S rRNA (cytosine1962-C5)-methyltransferase
VLNLFAYTGASTLMAAAAGAEVEHVDAARASVAWARRNADQSGLSDRPIRWIVEDVRKFVQRELKRGNRYQAIILDPPTYGHGPRGQAWKLEEHLPQLLADCHKLLDQGSQFVLLTCHAPDLGPEELGTMLKLAMPAPTNAQLEAGQLLLTASDGRTLNSGVFARW